MMDGSRWNRTVHAVQKSVVNCPNEISSNVTVRRASLARRPKTARGRAMHGLVDQHSPVVLRSNSATDSRHQQITAAIKAVVDKGCGFGGKL